MSTLKAKDLSKIGYTNDQARSLVINIASRHFKHHSKDELIALLTEIKANPENYIRDEVTGKIAATFLGIEEGRSFKVFSLLSQPGPLKIVGGKEIESSAKKQMEGAMALPITVCGALMPDAHTGYGLPIGGVLATDNAVIPYAVGVDIACRMKLTVYDRQANMIAGQRDRLANIIESETRFGMGCEFKVRRDHQVMDEDWSVSPVTKRLRDKAWSQLGTSGTGNHFVEFGVLSVDAEKAMALALETGEYISLLSYLWSSVG